MSNPADKKGWAKDGNRTWSGGIDQNTPPSDLPRNQVADAVNATMRGTRIGPRPGLKRRLLDIPDGIIADFNLGRWQHGAFWDGNGVGQLLCAIGGRFYRINLTNWKVDEITPADGGNSSLPEMGWSVQAENYWIYQDNHAPALIYNGATARRSDPAQKEVPVGNVMAYTMGRLVVALTDRTRFRAGDLVFGASGSAMLGYRDAMLKFTENDYLNEGGDFVARVYGANSAYGPITSMIPLNMLDQQLGQGPLLIGQPNMIFTMQLPFDRTQWKNMASAMQTANPLLGPLSQTSTVNVNGDVWYRSLDGIRSFIAARRDFTSVGNTPMSGEVHDILDNDTQFLLEHSSAVLFDNRLIMTVSPARDQTHGVYHRGLVSLDFNLVSNLRGKLAPAWEGLWTGLWVLQIVRGLVNERERCFVFAMNSNREIELWELCPGQPWDDDGFNITRISWSADLPSYNCGDSNWYKRLVGGRLVLENMAGNVDIAVKYRANESPCWIDWTTKSLCAANQDCCYNLTTTVTTQFVVPTAGNTVVVNVASTQEMSINFTAVTIGHYPLTLTNIGGPTQITLRNDEAGHAGRIVQVNSVLTFCGYDCHGPHTYRPQERTPVPFHAPADDFDQVNLRKNCTGFEFQPRVEFTGYAEMKSFEIFVRDEPETYHAERTQV